MKKIFVCECKAETVNDEFVNHKFKVLKGSDNEECLFSPVDLPQMNPYDWFGLYSVLFKEKSKYVNQLLHLKKMIRLYFMDMCKMDVEMGEFVKKKIFVRPYD